MPADQPHNPSFVTAPPPTPPKHDPYSAIRIANYRRFALGFFFSSLGLQALATAVSWEIFLRTNSDLALGLAGLVRAVPVLIMALPAGWLIDHVHRISVLVSTQAAFAFMALLLALNAYFSLPIALLYLLLFLMGCVRSFNGPTRSSLLPDLVPEHTFPNAVTWNSSIFHLSGLLGPLLAGGVLHLFSPNRTTTAAATATAESPTSHFATVYLLTALFCVLFAFLAARIIIPQRSAPKTALKPRDMLAGASHVYHDKVILGVISLDLFGVLFGGVTALLPRYASDILHVGELGYGALRAAPYLGAIIMAAILAHRSPMKNVGVSLLTAVAAFGLSIIVFALSTNFYLSLAALFLSGAVDSISVVIRHVLVQSRTPQSLRGRVSAVNSIFIECSNELGGLQSGLVSYYLGPVVSAASGGLGTIIVVAVIASLFPQLRKLTTLQSAANSAKPPQPTPTSEEVSTLRGLEDLTTEAHSATTKPTRN
ncbi:MAG: MFS transporter [Phycisphaerales bacterium]|nr:MFS transporter [Phycisphaerales bacterium]